MNILSYNIRGCGSSIKHESICKLVFKGKFDICLFKETKIQTMHWKLISVLWSESEVD